MRAYALALLPLLCRCVPSGHGRAMTPDLSRIADGRRWTVRNGESSTTTEGGKPVLRLAPRGGNRKGSNVALALAGGVELGQGTIEVDLRGNGRARASFVGVAFHVADEKSYEAVYFRPFNFQADDALHRAHAVQYVAWPEHTWEQLRTATPGVYESAIAPVVDPDRWFHARIEVTTRQVRVFVDGAAQPCLVVTRLGGRDRGGVGLWVDSQEGAFANLTIRPAP